MARIARTAASRGASSGSGGTTSNPTTGNSVQQAANSGTQTNTARQTTFNVSPAAANSGLLDYKDKEAVKIYDKASAKLVSDEFNCVEDQLHDFLAMLKVRAIQFGWDKAMMMVPCDPKDLTSRKISLLDEHGSLTFETIKAYESSYLKAKSRVRQDMDCLYQCLMASLSREGRNRVLTERQKYMLMDDEGGVHLSGNLLLKVIITKSSVDNHSGAYAIRMELGKLPTLIEKFNFNITKFNERVKGLTMSLSKMGQQSADLPFNLFVAYRTVPVPEFRAAIDRLRDEADNSDLPDRYTDVYIMDRAENKYTNLVQEKSWSVKDHEDNKILALEAKIRKLERANKGLGGKRGAGGKRRDKLPVRKAKKLDITRKPRDVNKPFMFNGKKFWWCSPETGGKCTGALRRHKPSECKGTEYLKDKKKGKEAKKQLIAKPAINDDFESDIDCSMTFD